VLAVADGGSHDLAALHPTQAQLPHQSFDRAAGHDRTFALELPPYFVGPIHLHIGLPDSFNLGQQSLVALGARAASVGLTFECGMVSIPGGGDLQKLADRLDPVGITMSVDKGTQDFKRRSSSAWAKNALASFNISLALRSSLFSRSSSLRRCRSVVVMPALAPVSTLFGAEGIPWFNGGADL
jgi:hypothetical protein